MKRGSIILGHPRSGTTLLRRLLNAHSRIASPPETHLFSACARFIERDHTADGVDMGVLSGLQFAGFESDQVLRNLREFAFQYLDQYTNSQGKSHWVEKTAFDIFKLDEIEALCCDDVSYIGIIRHPLDVAVSSREFCDAAGMYPKDMHKYIQRYSQPIEAFVHSWIDTTRSLIDLGERRSGDCIICRYEDLVENPDDILSEVLGFIGEEIEEGQVSKPFKESGTIGFSDHKSYQVSRIHSDSLKKWHGLPSHQVARLADEINPLLELCGYDAIDGTGIENHHECRRRYLNSLMVHANKSQR
jgi:hypothetical protein